MKHITYADKNLLTGDTVADLLLEYAALVARAADADTVSIACVDMSGNTVTVTILLDSGISLIAETTHSDLNEPDNAIIEQYLREQIDASRNPPSVIVPTLTSLTVPVEDFDL